MSVKVFQATIKNSSATFNLLRILIFPDLLRWPIINHVLFYWRFPFKALSTTEVEFSESKYNYRMTINI